MHEHELCLPKQHRLEENLGGVDLELTQGDLRRIESVLSTIESQGDRLPEAAMKMTGL